MQAVAIDRRWARPMNPRACGDEAYGCWKGDGEIYNILYVQPGFRYFNATEKTVDTYRRKGYEIIDTKLHKERYVGYGRMHARHGQVHGTEMALGEHILMRIPVEKYAAMRLRRVQRRQDSLDIPTTTLIDSNPAVRRQLNAQSERTGRNYTPSGDVFYALDDHRRNGYESGTYEGSKE